MLVTRRFERFICPPAATRSLPNTLIFFTVARWLPLLEKLTIFTVRGPGWRSSRSVFSFAGMGRHINGTAVPSHGLLPPGLFGRDAALAPYPYDPAKARALLAEAGYPDGFRAEYTMIADPELEMLTMSIQSDLAAVGVQIELATMSLNTYGIAIGKPDGPAFGFNGWIGDFPDPTSFLDAKFHSRAIAAENSSNDSRYSNPELDALLDAARADLDPASRAATYRRAEKLVYDDAPWIWGFHRLTTEVTQPYVRDYEPHPVWLRDYSYVWLDLGADGEPVPR